MARTHAGMRTAITRYTFYQPRGKKNSDVDEKFPAKSTIPVGAKKSQFSCENEKINDFYFAQSKNVQKRADLDNFTKNAFTGIDIRIKYILIARCIIF
jgi:hypothetical protein